MCVCDVSTELGRARDNQLTFEGFLEALCRVAVLKALPSDEEIDEAGCMHAADYMEMLLADNEEK